LVTCPPPFFTVEQKENKKRCNTDALQTLRDARSARSVLDCGVFRRFSFFPSPTKSSP
jgi:hypothetical protein